MGPHLSPPFNPMTFALALALVATFWVLLVLELILPFALTFATVTFPALVELAVDERLLRLGVLQGLNFPLMSCLPLVESIHFNCVLLPLCLETCLFFANADGAGSACLTCEAVACVGESRNPADCRTNSNLILHSSMIVSLFFPHSVSRSTLRPDSHSLCK